jgi:tRNA(adenine34) deaminase
MRAVSRALNATPAATAAAAATKGDAAAAAPPTPDEQDVRFMRLALQQAQAAFDAGEVPVGAVLVIDEQVVAAERNATEARRNPLSHAELLCISAAAEAQLAWRLQDATLYSTLEPCPMCAGAILQARLARLV